MFSFLFDWLKPRPLAVIIKAELRECKLAMLDAKGAPIYAESLAQHYVRRIAILEEALKHEMADK